MVPALCGRLTYNWWSLFVRLADPDHRREAITSRPLPLHGIARRTPEPTLSRRDGVCLAMLRGDWTGEDLLGAIDR